MATNSKTPMTTADVNADYQADQAVVDIAAEAFIAASNSAQAALEKLKQNPLGCDPPTACNIVKDARGFDELKEMFTPQNCDFLKRERQAAYFPARTKTIVTALSNDLDAKVAPLPTFKEKLMAYLREIPTKAFAASVSPAERDKVLLERDEREQAAAILEGNIIFARRAIRRFEEFPTSAHFGEAVAAISIIQI